VVEKIKRKRAGLPAEPQRVATNAPNVVSLMDALRRSISEDKGAKAPASKSAPKKGRKRVAGQGEMLLPISGKKAKEEPKPVGRTGARQKKAG
jgi:DNA end-binding protein Ku